MLELLASIGVLGVLMLVVGFFAILYLAKLIDDRNDYEGNDDD